jgi:hypothetical protein
MLKKEPMEMKLYEILMENMHECVEKGMGLESWINHIEKLGISISHSKADIIRSAIGTEKKNQYPSNPDEVTVETGFGQISMSHEMADKILCLGFLPLPEDGFHK